MEPTDTALVHCHLSVSPPSRIEARVATFLCRQSPGRGAVHERGIRLWRIQIFEACDFRALPGRLDIQEYSSLHRALRPIDWKHGLCALWLCEKERLDRGTAGWLDLKRLAAGDDNTAWSRFASLPDCGLDLNKPSGRSAIQTLS